MDLNWFLQQIPFDTFGRLTLEWDVDPEDEKTPGWTASVLLKDESQFIGHFGLTPSEAYEGLVGELIEQGYIEEAKTYGR